MSASIESTRDASKSSSEQLRMLPPPLDPLYYERLKSVFEAFASLCKTSRSSTLGLASTSGSLMNLENPEIDATRFVKLFKDLNLTCATLGPTELDIAFNKARSKLQRAQRRLDFSGFTWALYFVSAEKGAIIDELLREGRVGAGGSASALGSASSVLQPDAGASVTDSASRYAQLVHRIAVRGAQDNAKPIIRGTVPDSTRRLSFDLVRNTANAGGAKLERRTSGDKLASSVSESMASLSLSRGSKTPSNVRTSATQLKSSRTSSSALGSKGSMRSCGEITVPVIPKGSVFERLTSDGSKEAQEVVRKREEQTASILANARGALSSARPASSSSSG